jgi:hypothetical protein
MRSTRAGVSAEVQRMCSGTSVPGPRTSRNIVPQRTASSETISRSTLGAAGFQAGEQDREKDDAADGDGALHVPLAVPRWGAGDVHEAE